MKKAVIAIALAIVLALTASNVLLWLDQAGTVDLVGGPSPQSPSSGSPSGSLESRISALEREVGMDGFFGSGGSFSRIDSLQDDVYELRNRFPSNPFR